MINKGTKIGWVLVALSLVIAIWAVASNHLNAEGDESDWDIENGVLTSYKGKGGDVTVPAVVKEIAVGAFASHEVVDHDGGKENPPKENDMYPESWTHSLANFVRYIHINFFG